MARKLTSTTSPAPLTTGADLAAINLLRVQLETALDLARHATAKADHAHKRLDNCARAFARLQERVESLGIDVRELAHEHEALARS